MVERYEPYLADTSGDPTHGDMEQARMRESDDGEWVRREDVLAALQTLIDQLANEPEWRSGAVLAYNAIAESQRHSEPK